MTDVRTWARDLVSEMNGDDVIQVLSEGADGFRSRLDRLRSLGFGADDALDVVDDIERLCGDRMVVSSPDDYEDSDSDVND